MKKRRRRPPSSSGGKYALHSLSLQGEGGSSPGSPTPLLSPPLTPGVGANLLAAVASRSVSFYHVGHVGTGDEPLSSLPLLRPTRTVSVISPPFNSLSTLSASALHPTVSRAFILGKSQPQTPRSPARATSLPLFFVSQNPSSPLPSSFSSVRPSSSITSLCTLPPTPSKPSGRLVGATSNPSRLGAWNLSSGRLMGYLEPSRTDVRRLLSVIEWGEGTVVGGGAEGCFELDLTKGAFVRDVVQAIRIWDLEVCESENYVVGTSDSEMIVWDFRTGNQVNRLSTVAPRGCVANWTKHRLCVSNGKGFEVMDLRDLSQSLSSVNVGGTSDIFRLRCFENEERVIFVQRDLVGGWNASSDFAFRCGIGGQEGEEFIGDIFVLETSQSSQPTPVTPSSSPNPASPPTSPSSTSSLRRKTRQTIFSCVRIRPFSRSLDQGSGISISCSPGISESFSSETLSPGGSTVRTHSADAVFGPECSQRQIYERSTRRLVAGFLSGCDACLLCLGDASSGKFDSLYGPSGQRHEGLVCRAAKAIFRFAHEANFSAIVELSMFEVFFGDVFDLLARHSKPQSLRLRQTSKYDVFPEGILWMPVQNAQEVLNLVRFGLEGQSQTMEDDVQIPHSHVFLQFRLKVSGSKSYESKLLVVDIRECQGIWMEGVGENSLVRVFQVLAENSKRRKQVLPPFRDSKLTRLLARSVSERSLTTVLAHFPPTSYYPHQITQRIRFVSLAKLAVLQPRYVENPVEVLERLIRFEREEDSESSVLSATASEKAMLVESSGGDESPVSRELEGEGEMDEVEEEEGESEGNEETVVARSVDSGSSLENESNEEGDPQVTAFLRSNALSKYVSTFVEQEIVFEDLLYIRQNDVHLERLFPNVFPRERFVRAIDSRFGLGGAQPAEATLPQPDSVPTDVLSKLDSSLEMAWEDVTSLTDVFATGGFASVRRGQWNGEEVVVKDIIIQSKAFLEMAAEEVAQLHRHKHPRVIGVFGYSLKHGDPTVFRICLESMLMSVRKLVGRLNMDITGVSNSIATAQMDRSARRSRSLTIAQKFNILRQCAEGLFVLHECNTLHRDVKAENFLVSGHLDPWDRDLFSPVVKVSDFGLAKVKRTMATASVMTAKMGTLFWMAPELQNSPGREASYGFPADIYSLAFTIYEVLHGTTPFRSKHDLLRSSITNYNVRAYAVAGRRPALAKLRNWCPEFADLIERMWTRPILPSVSTMEQVLSWFESTEDLIREKYSDVVFHDDVPFERPEERSLGGRGGDDDDDFDITIDTNLL